MQSSESDDEGSGEEEEEKEEPEEGAARRAVGRRGAARRVAPRQTRGLPSPAAFIEWHEQKDHHGRLGGQRFRTVLCCTK